VIFALGIVGTGLLAIPVLAGATAYAVGEGRQWPVGLARKPKEAAAFYAVLALSAAIGIALNFTPINPISALYWSAVINGVLAVPVMVLLMFMAAPQGRHGPLRRRWPALLARMAVDAGDAAQRRGDGGRVFCLMSFRGDAKHRTTVRNCAPENLEIPGLVLRTIPE
jgi:Mn2+/Fe2+ NRAMP family transporter